MNMGFSIGGIPIIKNSRSNIIDDFILGSTLSDPYHGTPNSWSSNIVGKKLYESYMTKEEWTEQDYKEIASYALKQWVNNLEEQKAR